MLGFLGPNGAGKTTTMRAIFGLVEPDAGDGALGRAADRARTSACASGTCRRSVACTRGCRSASRSPTSAACTGWARCGAHRRRGVAGAARPRRARRREGRGALARQPAACSARGSARARRRSCSSSTSRSRGSTLSRCRRSPRCCAARPQRGAAVLFSSHQLELVEDICEEVAIIDHGRVVATGESASAARLGAAPDRRFSSKARPPEWLPQSAGVELVERATTATSACRSSATSIRSACLPKPSRSAQVVGFTYGPPSLSELFLELVTR